MLKLSLSQLQINSATLSFLLLFPGFFLYHFAVGRGYIPPVLGGYFGIVATFILIPLAVMNLKLFVKNVDLPVLIFFSIMFLTLSVTLVQYLLDNPTNFSKEMFVWSMSGLVFNLACFIVAAQLGIQGVAKAGYWLIALIFAIVVFNIGEFGIFYVQAESDDLSDIVSGYQGFARSIVAVLLIASAYYFHKGIKFYPLIILGVIALFFCGARTEFVLFILSLVFVYFFYSITSPKAFLILLFALVIVVLLLINIIDLLPDSRMFQIIDFSSNSSGGIRLQQFAFGIEKIDQHPFLGNYGSYVVNGGVGAYPHNILSAWINLGLVGFALYILLFIVLWGVALKGFLRKKSDDYFKVFLIFLVFTTVSILVSKNHSYMFVGLLVGFYIQYRNKYKGF